MLLARVQPTPTAALRHVCFVLLPVPVPLAANRSVIASAQPTPMPHLEPTIILEHVLLVIMAVMLNEPAGLAALPLRLACAQPTTMEII